MLDGICLPTKFYFSLSTLAGECRYDKFVGIDETPACMLYANIMYEVASPYCPKMIQGNITLEILIRPRQQIS